MKHGKMVEPCREAKAAEAIGWAEMAAASAAESGRHFRESFILIQSAGMTGRLFAQIHSINLLQENLEKALAEYRRTIKEMATEKAPE